MNFYADFTVTKTANFGVSKFGIKAIGNFLGKFWYGITCKELHIWHKWVPQCVDKRGLAGVAGLEPTNGGIKTRCLTNLAIPQFLVRVRCGVHTIVFF